MQTGPHTTMDNPRYKIVAVLSRMEVQSTGQQTTMNATVSRQGGTIFALVPAMEGVGGAGGMVPKPWPAQGEASLIVNGKPVPHLPRSGRNMPQALNTFSPLSIEGYMLRDGNEMVFQIDCVSHSDWGCTLMLCQCIETTIAAIIGRTMITSGAVATGPEAFQSRDLSPGVGAHLGSYEEVSLRCPLTLQRMNYPGVGRGCHHQACFDIQTYIAEACAISQWNCPICLGPVPPDQIVASQLVLEAIDQLSSMCIDECDTIRVFGGCRWEPVGGGGEQLPNDYEMPYCKRERID